MELLKFKYKFIQFNYQNLFNFFLVYDIYFNLDLILPFYPFNEVTFYLNNDSFNFFTYTNIEKFAEKIEIIIEKIIENFCKKTNKSFLELKKNVTTKNENNSETKTLYSINLINNFRCYTLENYNFLEIFFTYLLTLEILQRNIEINGKFFIF